MFQEERLPIDQVVALWPAEENMKDISVTLEVFQEERSRVKVVALWPAEENMLDILVTLDVSQVEMVDRLDRARIL